MGAADAADAAAGAAAAAADDAPAAALDCDDTECGENRGEACGDVWRDEEAIGLAIDAAPLPVTGGGLTDRPLSPRPRRLDVTRLPLEVFEDPDAADI
mmetsp:Transcript_28807/g.63437  ORF Transcript_28807/g.63437 Transcript_28807/m.63437 type:complete len:98 (-) Transcript_28807:565-858(-)